MNGGQSWRVFVLIPTHTTRHLACCLASLAHQGRPPDGVVVTCDNDSAELAELLAAWWPRVCARAGREIPLWHTRRPHQGEAHLNQVRNNGLRTLINEAGAAGRDLVVVLDGDTMLAPDALALHAATRDSGADYIIPYRVLLDEDPTGKIDAEVVLRDGPDVKGMLTAAEMKLLSKRQSRYRRHLLMSRLGLSKPNKPRLIGGHHAMTIATAQRVNGFDEDYVGYRFNDDDMARRLNRLRPRPKTVIACDIIFAFHMWHTIRAPARLQDAPGWTRFNRKDLPIFAEHGITSPRSQPAVQVSRVMTGVVMGGRGSADAQHLEQAADQRRAGGGLV